MMSLTTISMGSLVKKQYQFKLKSYVGLFNSLMVVQLLAIVFSFVGSGQSGGGGSYGPDVRISYYSADAVVYFTIMWAFISAILITTKAYREDDFTFVTNRLSGNLSNILLLLSASVIGGVTAVLSGYLIKALIYYVFDFNQVIGIGSGPSLQEFFIGLVATILTVFLFSSLGYLVGTLIQLHRTFVVVLPVVFFGLLIIAGKMTGVYSLFSISEFYFQESSFWLFFFKIIITATLLFSGAALMSNRWEVRR